MSKQDDPKTQLAEPQDFNVEKKMLDFTNLLKTIESLDDQKRELWRQIYENSICDRQNAYVMFTQLVQIVDSKSTEFAVHGKTLTAFIERMSKANDQLIRLAELIAKAERGSDEIDTDEMFARIVKK